MTSDQKIKDELDEEKDPLDILKAQIENMSPIESIMWSDDRVIKENKNES